ncbi:MAG TPA: hypothetical protein VLE51_02780 [Candidatus Saccharimonadales bacterium]|nr:hypothetical protein [Candidatus Saccharimonadales bacterium]
MSKRKISDIPSPAIDGALEVTIGAMHSGMELTEASRTLLDLIYDHEDRLARPNRKRPNIDSERVQAAQHHVGQLAAIHALLEPNEKPYPIGFSS